MVCALLHEPASESDTEIPVGNQAISRGGRRSRQVACRPARPDRNVTIKITELLNLWTSVRAGVAVRILTVATEEKILILVKERSLGAEFPAESEAEMASGGILSVAIVFPMRYVIKKITTGKNRAARNAAGALHPFCGDGDMYGYDVFVEMLQQENNGMCTVTGGDGGPFRQHVLWTGRSRKFRFIRWRWHGS